MRRILFVAMPESVHTARWLSQLEGQDWEVYLFPVHIAPANPELRGATVFASTLLSGGGGERSVRFIWWTIPLFWIDWMLSKLRRSPALPLTTWALALVINQLKPDIIHSLEIQHAGYLTLEARNQVRGEFPKWIVTNWGSDIYLFGRLAEHRPRIEAVLHACDFYSCECQRDVKLARDLGFEGPTLPVLPNTGGFDLEKALALRISEPSASRRMILLKGYQHWAGRALVGLEALRRCVDLLRGYTVAISVASPEVQIAAELFSQDTQIPVQIIGPVSHSEMLGFYARSRVYIGLSISDAISTSLLEAIVMGAFPVQSCTACADEWIQDGKGGLIVPPEDPAEVALAIRRALTEDILINTAAEINWLLAEQRLDRRLIQPQVLSSYEAILQNVKKQQAP